MTLKRVMPATHCRLQVGVERFSSPLLVFAELWDKLNFMIYTTKKTKPNIDGVVKSPKLAVLHAVTY